MNNVAPAESASHRAIRACVALCCVVLLALSSVAQVAAEASGSSSDSIFEMSTMAALDYSLAAGGNVEERSGAVPPVTILSIGKFAGAILSLPFRRLIAVERPVQLDPTPP